MIEIIFYASDRDEVSISVHDWYINRKTREMARFNAFSYKNLRFLRFLNTFLQTYIYFVGHFSK